MKMRVINNIFYRRGLPVLGGVEVQTFWFRVLSTTLLQPLRSVPCLRCGGPEERAAEVVPVVPVVPVGPRRGGAEVLGGRAGRWMERPDAEEQVGSVESGTAEVVPGLLFRAAVPGGGGVSDGGAGLAVSGGRAGRRRLCRTVALGGGGVGRWRSRWTEDGETERGWAGGRGRPPLPHACRWSVPVSVPSRKSDVRRGKTAPKLVFARTKAYL